MGVLKWLILIIGGLAFMITAVFAVMLLMTDPAPKKDPGKSSKSTAAQVQNSKSGSQNTKIAGIKSELEKLRKQLKLRDQQIDSLKQVAEQVDKQNVLIEKLQKELNGVIDKKARAKEMAKTFSSMKVKAMSPILNKLDDETVMLIYDQTSKTARKDILLALDENRAAKITSKLINKK